MTTDTLRQALITIAEMPLAEQDNMLSANMRAVARTGLAAAAPAAQPEPKPIMLPAALPGELPIYHLKQYGAITRSQMDAYVQAHPPTPQAEPATNPKPSVHAQSAEWYGRAPVQAPSVPPGWAIETGKGWLSIRNDASQCGQDFYPDRDPLIFGFLSALAARPTQPTDTGTDTEGKTA